MSETTKLPPLPERECSMDSGRLDFFTAQQMREYGAECRCAALEEAAHGCHTLGDRITADMQRTRGIRARELLSSAAVTAYKCAAVLRTLKDKA